jgi:hypothetical protein
MATPRAKAPIDHMPKCTAHRTRDGQPCQHPAMRGQAVCTHHGGKAPQNIESAALRIQRIAEGPALRRLEDLVESRNEAVALGAVKDALDRAGVGKDKVAAPGVVAFTLRIDRGGSDSTAG